VKDFCDFGDLPVVFIQHFEDVVPLKIVPGFLQRPGFVRGSDGWWPFGFEQGDYLVPIDQVALLYDQPDNDISIAAPVLV